MADGGTYQYGNIILGGRGGLNSGQLKVSPAGFAWRKLGGAKPVEVYRSDIVSTAWTKIPRGFQLTLQHKAGHKIKFNGFREQDVPTLSTFLKESMGLSPADQQLAVSGRNWGDVEMEGNMLSFNVGGRQAFEVCITDVSQTTMVGKNEVSLEFHVDDTTGANEKDAMMEMSFHIPPTNVMYAGDDDHVPAQVFYDKILRKADVGLAQAEAIATFEDVYILVPRGKHTVELHSSYFRLMGQANDFKIQYSSIVRLFVLPKANQPHVFVIVTLDPPIRKGQTLYLHIVMQFPSEEETEVALSVSDELLATKYKDRLDAAYKGFTHEVFTKVLMGLSEAKVTRPGKFRSNASNPAVRCSLKAEDGYLYPLEKSLFFLPKPPTLILHEEIQYVEFASHGGAGTSGLSSNYFDIVVRLASEAEHQFRNIARNEYDPLIRFIQSKGLKVLNLRPGSGGGMALGGGDDDGDDPHLARVKAGRGGPADEEESDEEDEDFVADGDESSSDDDSEGGGSGSGSEKGSDDDTGADEDEDEEEEKPKKKQKEKTPPKPKPARPAKKAKVGDGDEEGGGAGGKGKAKAQRKKKDPNAPKRSLSAFMYFSQKERERMKRDGENLPFSEVGKAIGEKWGKMSGEEKTPFEKLAKEDKVRYEDAMKTYKAKGAEPEGSDGDEDSAERGSS